MPAGIENRAAPLVLDPSRPRRTRLDLIEWIRPKTHRTSAHRPPPADLAHVGFARIVPWTIDLDAEYKRPRSAGVEFISEPVALPDARTRFCWFYDPDGAVLELIEFADRPSDGRSR